MASNRARGILAFHEHPFKNGGFRQLVTQTMPPSQSLRLLRESTLTTNAEKEVPRTTGMYLANPTDVGNESSMPNVASNRAGGILAF